jgi:pyruvate formate lyase activating enzyme
MPDALIFDIQRFSIQDGPGIRTTAFLKGCPLACAWCHNPESQRRQPEVVTLEHRCLRCGACRAVCPEGIGTNLCETCTNCGLCVEACPSGARQMVGRSYDIAELTRELVRDRLFYEESGGGATFSGGEPLGQVGFLLAALEAARGEGVHTAVDTCGFAPLPDLLAVAKRTDLFLFDLKLVDDERHRHYTGVSNVLILNNLKALAQEHGNLWVRIPVISGINDDDDSVRAAAELLTPLPGVREVHLLPYHGTGESKFARLGRSYDLTGTGSLHPLRLERLAGIFTDAGLAAKVAGSGMR